MRVAVGLAFAAYLLAGVAIHGDYGLSWDEAISRELGSRTFHYLSARASGEPASWADMSRGLVAEYGQLFETTLFTIETVLGLEDSADVYRMRHLVTFLAFWLGTVAFYGMLRLRFDDRRVALAGTAMLVLAPRLFAHSFYNSKDAVLAALFMTGMLTMLHFVRDRSWPWVLAHALVCAAAVGIRVAGLLLPAVTFVAFVMQIASEGRNPGNGDRYIFLRKMYLSPFPRSLLVGGAFAVLFLGFTFAFWPAIWDDPAHALQRALKGAVASKQALRNSANHSTLYLGRFVEVTELPWHYLPVWILISVPLFTLAMFATGLWVSARRLLEGRLLEWESIQTIAFLLLFFVPAIAVVVLPSTLYDDWRHLYFLYPPLVAIAASGLHALWQQPRLHAIVPAAVLVAALHGLFMIVHDHPYQNVYFNVLAGRDVESSFELDYWGLSFREGLEYVLKTDASEKIRVSASDYPGPLNAKILTAEQRSRLEFGPVENADWFLSNHRQPKHFADFRERRFPCVNEAYAVRVDGATLLGVYKLR